ncbi:MAG: hypothetical protein HY841_04835 [Bacteroidetes bacterium]|nr:hypothetical protein [Bacteroidota bacterium]
MKKQIIILIAGILFAPALLKVLPFGKDFGWASCSAQNIGINTDGSSAETGVMLHVKGTNLITAPALQNIFQVTSYDASAAALKLRLGLYGNATATSRYGLIDVWDATAGAYRSLCLQPSGGNVGIGTTSPSAITLLHVLATTEKNIINERVTNLQADLGGIIINRRARGTIGALTTILNGDELGKYMFSGYDGSNYIITAQIDAVANGTIAAGSIPTDITFSTGTADMAYVERMRITSSGNVGIRTIPIYPLDVLATVTSASWNARLGRFFGTLNGSGDGAGGLESQPTFSPSASVGVVYGIAGVANANPGAGINIANVNCGHFRFDSQAGSAGTVTNASGVMVALPGLSGIKPSNIYGLNVQNLGAAGITNSYGLFIQTQSGATNNYAGIFQGGNVGIGTITPAASLEVDGSSGSTVKIVDGNQAVNKVLTSDATGQGSWQSLSSIGGSCFPNWQLYLTSGTSGMLGAGAPTTFTVPAGVTLIKIAVWGGGAYGTTSGANTGGAGGGGGGYAEGTYVVVPATVYQITVGTGGINATSTAATGSCFSTGAACTGTILIQATGGNLLTGGMGSGGYLNTTLGSGGTAGLATATAASYNGGNGSGGGGAGGSGRMTVAGPSYYGGGGGGGGIGGGDGGQGGIITVYNALANTGAGGGGAGGGSWNGANGADGKIIVTW